MILKIFDLGNKKIWQKKLPREKDYTNQPPKTIKNNRNLLSKIFSKIDF